MKITYSTLAKFIYIYNMSNWTKIRVEIEHKYNVESLVVFEFLAGVWIN
jgi:hypothetical protein